MHPQHLFTKEYGQYKLRVLPGGEPCPVAPPACHWGSVHLCADTVPSSRDLLAHALPALLVEVVERLRHRLPVQSCLLGPLLGGGACRLQGPAWPSCHATVCTRRHADWSGRPCSAHCLSYISLSASHGLGLWASTWRQPSVQGVGKGQGGLSCRLWPFGSAAGRIPARVQRAWRASPGSAPCLCCPGSHQCAAGACEPAFSARGHAAVKGSRPNKFSDISRTPD